MMREARSAIGKQAVGYGKNYHTEFPEPITWENISKLDHFITSLDDGSFLAGVSLIGSDVSTPTYKFNSETEALAWVKSVSDRFTIEVSNQES